jgi:uncharacterized metal-binding protein YceD (DUF177 family)
MSRPAFSVPAADLERGEKSVCFVVPEAWLRLAFAETGAEPQGDGTLDVELVKTGASVMVRGRARAEVTVPCVVTLDPLPFSLRPEVFLLLSPAEGAVVRGPAGRGRAENRGGPAHRRPKGRPGRLESDDFDDSELEADAAAKDTYDGENIVLDAFLREFLLLELPLYPRRADLPSDPTPAIAPPSSATEPKAAVDPRLRPLAAIAKRLEEKNKE